MITEIWFSSFLKIDWWEPSRNSDRKKYGNINDNRFLWHRQIYCFQRPLKIFTQHWISLEYFNIREYHRSKGTIITDQKSRLSTAPKSMKFGKAPGPSRIFIKIFKEGGSNIDGRTTTATNVIILEKLILFD